MNIVEALSQYFNLDELKGISVELGIDFEEFPTKGKSVFIREFIRYCSRSNRMDDLIRVVKEKRPFLALESPQPFPLLEQINTKRFSIKEFARNHWKLIVTLIVIVGALVTTFYEVRSRIQVDNTPSPEATSIILSINIIDSSTGLPIVRTDVAVLISGTPPISALTDDNGNASIQIPIEYTDKQASINVRATGFEPKSINLFLSIDNNAVQTIQLAPILE
jgi:hypothetical protein